MMIKEGVVSSTILSCVGKGGPACLCCIQRKTGAAAALLQERGEFFLSSMQCCSSPNGSTQGGADPSRAWGNRLGSSISLDPKPHQPTSRNTLCLPFPTLEHPSCCLFFLPSPCVGWKGKRNLPLSCGESKSPDSDRGAPYSTFSTILGQHKCL